MFRSLTRLAGAALTSAGLLSVLAAFLTAQAPARAPVPVLAGAAILVVGGTPAGVAAAVAAARQGQDVTLVARRPVLGGILTDAMMDQWDFNLAPAARPCRAGCSARSTPRWATRSPPPPPRRCSARWSRASRASGS